MPRGSSWLRRLQCCIPQTQVLPHDDQDVIEPKPPAKPTASPGRLPSVSQLVVHNPDGALLLMTEPTVVAQSTPVSEPAIVESAIVELAIVESVPVAPPVQTPTTKTPWAARLAIAVAVVCVAASLHTPTSTAILGTVRQPLCTMLGLVKHFLYSVSSELLWFAVGFGSSGAALVPGTQRTISNATNQIFRDAFNPNTKSVTEAIAMLFASIIMIPILALAASVASCMIVIQAVILAGFGGVASAGVSLGCRMLLGLPPNYAHTAICALANVVMVVMIRF